MSCDNSVPIDDIVDQVREALSEDFVRADAPAVTGGVFTNPILKAPSIRGDVLFDRKARESLLLAVSGRVQDPPSVVGSRADGSALASLISVLAGMGIVIDDTTT